MLPALLCRGTLQRSFKVWLVHSEFPGASRCRLSSDQREGVSLELHGHAQNAEGNLGQGKFMEECVVRWMIVVLCGVSFATCAADHKGPATEAKVVRLLTQGRYKQIDRMERHLRTSNAINDEDQPALYTFYKALAGSGMKTEAKWDERLKLLEKWKDEDTESYVPTLALAKYYYFYGWWLRSTRAASALSKRQVTGFQNNLRESLRLADSITAQAYDDPAWYGLILWLGVAQGWPKPAFDQMYDKAVAVRPDYLPLLYAKATYLSARWYGSDQEFAAYVDYASQKYGRYFGNRLYGRLQYSLQIDEMFDTGQADWEKTKQSYAAIVSAYPTRRSHKEFAELACMAEDWEVAAKNLAAMNPRVSTDEGSGLYLWRCELYAKQYTEAIANRSAAEVKASVEKINDRSSDIGLRWQRPAITLDAPTKEGESIADAAKIAAVASDRVSYRMRRDIVFDVAKHDPAVISLMDEHQIELLERDFAAVVYQVAKRDPATAVREMRRIPNWGYDTRDRIRTYYGSKLGGAYAAWVWQYPGLWGTDEIAAFVKALPGATLSRLERTSNPEWNIGYATDILVTLHPEDLFKYLVTLPTEQRESALKHAISRLEKTDLDKALDIVAKYDDDSRQSTTEVLLDAMKQGRDPIAMLDQHDLHVPKQNLEKIIRELAYRRPKMAAHYLSRVDAITKRRLVYSVSYYYRNNLGDNFGEWLKANPEWNDGTYKEAANASLIKEAKRDQLAVLKKIYLPVTLSQKDGVTAFTQVVNVNPKGARDWLDKTAREVPDTSIAIVAEALLQRNEPGVYEWLSRFPQSEELSQVRIEAFARIARRDPVRGSTMIAAMPSDQQYPAIGHLLDAWLGKDPKSAVKWVQQLAPGYGRDVALTFTGLYMSQTSMDYKAALKFFNEIGDPNGRRAAVMNIMPIIYAKDPDKFSALAAQYGFNQYRIQAFKKAAESLKDVTPPAAVQR